jgi:hypothetical protein
MSNYKNYKLEDNLKRKSNNVGDEIGFGPNVNVKSYSSKPGRLSSKQQADFEEKQGRKKYNSEVRILSKEEISKIEEQLKSRKSA